MVMGHFLQTPEIGVDGCRLGLIRPSPSVAASGVAVVVAAAAAAPVVAEACATAEAFYK